LAVSVPAAAGGSALFGSGPEVSRQTVSPLVVRRRYRCWGDVPVECAVST